MKPGEKPTNLKITLDLETGEVLKNELIFRSENKKKGIGRGGRHPKKEGAPA